MFSSGLIKAVADVMYSYRYISYHSCLFVKFIFFMLIYIYNNCFGDAVAVYVTVVLEVWIGFLGRNKCLYDLNICFGGFYV